MAQNFYGSICLSDIPKELIVESKNGKKYINIDIFERREVGMYGDTHNIKIACPKDKREEGKNYYIGNLRPSKFDNEPQAANPQSTEIPAPQFNEQPAIDDGLPF